MGEEGSAGKRHGARVRFQGAGQGHIGGRGKAPTRSGQGRGQLPAPSLRPSPAPRANTGPRCYGVPRHAERTCEVCA